MAFKAQAVDGLDTSPELTAQEMISTMESMV